MQRIWLEVTSIEVATGKEEVHLFCVAEEQPELIPGDQWRVVKIKWRADIV